MNVKFARDRSIVARNERNGGLGNDTISRCDFSRRLCRKRTTNPRTTVRFRRLSLSTIEAIFGRRTRSPRNTGNQREPSRIGGSARTFRGGKKIRNYERKYGVARRRRIMLERESWFVVRDVENGGVERVATFRDGLRAESFVDERLASRRRTRKRFPLPSIENRRWRTSLLVL